MSRQLKRDSPPFNIVGVQSGLKEFGSLAELEEG
jgi:hypothetical protein